MTAPVFALTMGDPAGVGPEITAAAWRALRGSGPAFAVIGPPDLYAAQGVPITEISAGDDFSADARRAFADTLAIVPQDLAAPVRPGAPDVANAPMVIAAIAQAVDLCKTGRAAGMVTNPVAKSVLQAAGFAHPGHTEFIAALTNDMPQTGPRGPVMMLIGDGLRVALATIHMPLRKVSDALSADRLNHVIAVTYQALVRDFGLIAPKIALCGLNPHAGEGGVLGDEEIRVINPVARAMRDQGRHVTDAQSADALFTIQARAGYDAAIAMYHDQGLIPVKTLDFHGGVNVTLGLPIVRTSPDHGTAFGIAGTRKADPGSVIAAIRHAADIAAHRAKTPTPA